MKSTSTIAPALLACLISLTLTNAGPIPTSPISSRSITDTAVDALYIREVEAEIISRATGLELEAREFLETELKARGGASSKQTPKKDSKASYPVGNNRPETPTGEFRKFTAGRDDDYFADWQTMTGGQGKSGVNNPAAGKGKKTEKRDY